MHVVNINPLRYNLLITLTSSSKVLAIEMGKCIEYHQTLPLCKGVATPDYTNINFVVNHSLITLCVCVCVCVCVYLCTCRSVSSLSTASTTSISRTVRKTGGGFFAALN